LRSKLETYLTVCLQLKVTLVGVLEIDGLGKYEDARRDQDYQSIAVGIEKACHLHRRNLMLYTFSIPSVCQQLQLLNTPVFNQLG